MANKLSSDTGMPHQDITECTYDHCDEKFDTLKNMQRHKQGTDMHFYCKKCDIDFPDDMQHIMHRIVTQDRHSEPPTR
jgi:hypothetical protein